MSDHPQDVDSDRLLDHEYDGIAEFDNPMPRWWVYLFWATIVFAAAYLLDPTHQLAGPGRLREYEADLARFQREHPAPVGGTVGNEVLLAASHDAAQVADGKAVFTANCVACHRADGGGLIGPNLTDDSWLHGGTPAEIYHTIREGVLAKGMPAWGKMLKPEQVQHVAAYVLTLHGTNPPNAKAAEGVPVAGR